MEVQIKQKSKLQRLLQFDVNISKYKQIFFENLVMMISSGVNVATAIEQFKTESKIKALEDTLNSMINAINSGIPFWQILEKQKIVKGNMLDIIRIGEESGNLENNLQIVLLQQRKDKEISAKLQTASLYPTIVLGVLLIVSSVIAVFVLPRLTEIYSSFNTELPPLTQAMITIGDFMGKYGTVFMPSLITTIGLIVYFVFFFAKTKWIGQKLLLNFPVIKNAIIQLEMTRFGYLTYSLLDSGFRMLDALDIISASTNLLEYKKMYEFFAASISNGDSFSQTFEKYPQSRKLLPLFARQAITSGEQTGKLQEAFKQIGDVFQKEYDYSTANLYVLLEPILLIIVWLGVAGMALAVILPIYNLIGNFSTITDPNSDANTNSISQVKPTVQILPKVELASDGQQTIPVYSTRGGNIFLYAKHGDVFEVFNKDDNWYELLMKDGSVGLVEQKYVKEIKDVTVTNIVK
jgi:type II secretory pathway component PulF